MIDRLALYALAPLTFAGGLFGLDAPDQVEMQSFGSAVESGGEVRIARAADGLFYIPVKVGGTTLEMALDTGATRSVLPSRGVGSDLIRDRASGGVIESLDGRVSYDRATLRDVAIGSKRFARVEVAVADIAFSSPLLGQDLLRRLGPVTIDGDTLILR